MSQKPEMKKVLTLAIVEDEPFMIAKMCKVGEDIGDPDVGLEIARVANGAYHGSAEIRDAFFELAKAVIMFGAAPIATAENSRFSKDEINGD